MRRSTNRRDSRWVRGFDWDSASFAASLPTNTTAFDWLRWPSDQVDPAQDQLIAPKTCVKMLVGLHSQTSSIANGSTWHAWFGIIAIDSVTPASFGGPDVPFADVGAYDWMAWIHFGATNVSGAAGTYNTQFNAQGTDTGMLEYKSQRRLPVNRGILWVATFQGPAASTLSVNGGVRLGLKGDVTAAGLGGG